MNFPSLNQIVWFSNMPDEMAGCGIVTCCDDNFTIVQVPYMNSYHATMVTFEGDSRTSVCGMYNREDWSFKIEYQSPT